MLPTIKSFNDYFKWQQQILLDHLYNYIKMTTIAKIIISCLNQYSQFKYTVSYRSIKSYLKATKIIIIIINT